MKFNYLPPLLMFAIACVLLIAQQNQQRQQPASKRFIKGNIPLEEIFAEWNTKGLKGPRYICLCSQIKCGHDQVGPNDLLLRVKPFQFSETSTKTANNRWALRNALPSESFYDF